MPWTTRLARRLLGWLMPADLRDFFLDDLDEAFSIRVASQGRWRGAFWYWRQVITGLPFILRIRIRVGLTNHTPEVSGMTAIDTLVQDVRHAVHILATSPGFTLAAATTLALGIGANTAIFSVIRTVILQPPPYGAPDRVVMIWNDAERSAITHLSVREVVSYRESTRSLEHVAAYTEAGANLTGGQEPERVKAAYVTAGLFDALGVPALLGRTFLDAEDAPGADAVVVLGHGLWQRRFGAVADIVGRTIPVNGSPRTVVGVMPPSFRLPLDYRAGRPTELFVPLGIDPANLGAWGDRSYIGVGLLRAGIAPAAATSEFKIISDGWIRAGFVADQGDGRLARSAIPVQELITGEVRRPLLILLGAVGFILLIACANLVNLLLARADLRRREVAVRAALGAVRGRIVRQLLTESLLLSIVGGVLGLAIAYAGTAALTAIGWAGVPRLEEAGIGADALAFAAALTVVSGIVSGLAPAFSLSRPDLSRVLQDGGRSGTPGRTRLAIRRALVVFQLACSVVLVIGAGLLVRSLVELYRVDLGFDPRNVLTAQLLLPPSDYPESADVVRFYRRITERAAQLPGVTAAGAVRVLPLSRMIGNWSITLEGRPHSREENPNADFQWVTPGYFEAMRTTIVRGRFVSAADREDSPLVVVVNDTMAARYWPGEDAVGKRFHMGGGGKMPLLTIVGIVRTARHNRVVEEPRAEMYLPHAQLPRSIGNGAWRMALVVKSDADPLATVAPLREVVREMDPDLPLADIRTMEEVTAAALAGPRFATLLLGFFAALALALAAIGIYGVVSLLVTERAHEIGIRMALGAARRSILTLILGQGLVLAAVGIALGLTGALFLTRLLQSLVYGVGTADPLTFIAVPLLLGGVALAACLAPALRAASVDPVVTLREG